MERRLTTEDVCKIYGVTPKTLTMWKKKLKMPYYSFGREDYYLKEELEEWEKKYHYNASEK